MRTGRRKARGPHGLDRSSRRGPGSSLRGTRLADREGPGRRVGVPLRGRGRARAERCPRPLAPLPRHGLMRRYRGFMADSARWERFAFRPDDVIISTPSKCGTTWMQNIVGMLVLDRTDLGAPISSLSPWLDMLIRTDEDVFGLLEAQRHRRFIKTHTPLDGLP